MKQTDICCIHKKNSELGFATLIVLVILMSLTVLSVGVMMSATTNFAMSRNFEKNSQARNMSEIGIKVAYREFINSGYIRTTHTFQKGGKQTDTDSLLTTDLEHYYIDDDGDFAWEWDSSKAYDPICETDKPHGFRFSVHYSSDFAFVIESEGWFDTIHRFTRARGEVENIFQFSYFASHDLGDFSRGDDQVIRGKIHSNGNIYIKPSIGSNLDFETSSFKVTGSIIRTRDAFCRPDSVNGGTCEITAGSDTGTLVEMEPDRNGPPGNDGSAFDSFNANWADRTNGARATWGGVVKDKIQYKSPPPIQNLALGGYYNQLAQSGGVVIDTASDSYSWCRKVLNVYNYNEQRSQTIWEVNIGDMITAGALPGNGLIYCKVPVRLANASSLPGNLMVASCRNVFTLGDFNIVSKEGVAIMTMHRIYHLSGNWSDTYISSTILDDRVATDTTINSALVDGVPAVDVYNWVDRDGDHKYDYPDNTQLIYDDWNLKTASGFNYPDYCNNPIANCEDLLEKWSGAVLTIEGSIIHLGASYDVMANNLDNSGILEDQIAWVRNTGYSAPTLVFTYDSNLATPAGKPPFTPLVGHITSWAPF